MRLQGSARATEFSIQQSFRWSIVKLNSMNKHQTPNYFMVHIPNRARAPFFAEKNSVLSRQKVVATCKILKVVRRGITAQRSTRAAPALKGSGTWVFGLTAHSGPAYQSNFWAYRARRISCTCACHEIPILTGNAKKVSSSRKPTQAYFRIASALRAFLTRLPQSAAWSN